MFFEAKLLCGFIQSLLFWLEGSVSKLLIDHKGKLSSKKGAAIKDYISSEWEGCEEDVKNKMK